MAARLIKKCRVQLTDGDSAKKAPEPFPNWWCPNPSPFQKDWPIKYLENHQTRLKRVPAVTSSLLVVERAGATSYMVLSRPGIHVLRGQRKIPKNTSRGSRGEGNTDADEYRIPLAHKRISAENSTRGEPSPLREADRAFDPRRWARLRIPGIYLGPARKEKKKTYRNAGISVLTTHEELGHIFSQKPYSSRSPRLEGSRNRTQPLPVPPGTIAENRRLGLHSEPK